MFRDYRSTLDDVKFSQQTSQLDHQAFYTQFIEYNNASGGSADSKVRLLAEKKWYANQRPYFNVYPVIEKKLLELPDSIDLSKLVIPFGCIEVRTNHSTVLLFNSAQYLFLVFDITKNKADGAVYQLVGVLKSATIRSVLDGTWSPPPIASAGDISREDADRALFVAAGVCLLPHDNKIVQPVVLNCHRKDRMTDADWNEYSKRAAARTGRVGFEVGRDIERMPPSTHYRNGHFWMKPYGPGKAHRMIDWRVGAVVNGDKPPEVPTGFKDAG